MRGDCVAELRRNRYPFEFFDSVRRFVINYWRLNNESENNNDRISNKDYIYIYTREYLRVREFLRKFTGINRLIVQRWLQRRFCLIDWRKDDWKFQWRVIDAIMLPLQSSGNWYCKVLWYWFNVRCNDTLDTRFINFCVEEFSFFFSIFFDLCSLLELLENATMRKRVASRRSTSSKVFTAFRDSTR